MICDQLEFGSKTSSALLKFFSRYSFYGIMVVSLVGNNSLYSSDPYCGIWGKLHHHSETSVSLPVIWR